MGALLLLGLVLGCSEPEPEAPAVEAPAEEEPAADGVAGEGTTGSQSVDPEPDRPEAVSCALPPLPDDPPPLLERPESQRVVAQLQLLGLEGSCQRKDAGAGTTGNQCEFDGRGLHVSGQLLYNPEGAGRVKDNTDTRGPWRTWITTHPTWGGFMDVTDVSCAERMRDQLAEGGSMDYAKVARRVRLMGWKALCTELDEQGRGVCKLVPAPLEEPGAEAVAEDGTGVEGQLVYLRRPEGARAAEESRSTEKGQARWVTAEGVVAITLGREATTLAVREAVFPDAPLEGEEDGSEEAAEGGEIEEASP